MNRQIVQWLLLLGVGLCLTNVAAQDTHHIRQTSLPAILVDPGGDAVGITGNWSVDLLNDLYNFLHQRRQAPVPTFIIRNVTATGKVVGKFVEVDTQIELRTSSYQPVRIPLGFKEGILPGTDQLGNPPFRYSGTGSAEIVVDPNESQYVAILLPQTEPPPTEQVEGTEEPTKKPDIFQEHTLSLTLWFPLVQHNGNGHRLALSFPQANSSQLSLEVPMTNITPSVIRGTLLDKQENVEQESTRLTIQGLRTDTEIIWEKKKDEVVDDRPVLTVDQATISVQIDAGTTVYDAVLPVSSTTGSFDRLLIRLPQGCVLDRGMTDRHAVANNYSIGDVDAESIVTIQFQEKTTGPVPIQLHAAQHFDGDTAGFTRELAGFEIIGAERQTGFVNVSIFPLEMRPHWEMIRGVRRTEGAAQSTVAAVTPAVAPSTNDTRFEFISQPFRFNVRVTQPRTRINVKPEYQFHVRRGAIAMDARLSYTVSGSKAKTLYLQLSDSQWHCEIMSNFVDIDGVDLDAAGLLTIPLNNPRDGNFDIELRAFRTIPTEEEEWHRLVLPIPQPQQVTWTETASVAIVLDNNVEILPIDESYTAESEERMVGLARQSRRQMLQSPMRLNLADFADIQQEPLYYRTEPAAPVFVADVMFRRLKVDTRIQTDVRLLDEFNQVTQNVHYHAAYDSVERLYFLVPQALEASDDIRVLLDNQTLQLQNTISSTWENVPDGWVRKMILLPTPRFQFSLTFEYSLPPLTKTEGVDAMRFSMFFICPTEVPVTDHRIHFFTPSGYRLELQTESRLIWESFRDPRPLLANATESYRSLHMPNRIALLVSALDRSVSGTTVVERAWLQTWLTGTFRRDLATYTVRSTNESVMIQLPPNAAREHPVIVRVDRQQIQPNISLTGTLTIPIAPEQRNRPVEISVDYRFSFEMPPFEVPIILPSFDSTVQYQYWQIVLPQSKHIVSYPLGWTLEYDWTWNGLFWWRVPSIRKEDIGFTTDSTQVEPSIAESSQYVFSHLQPPSNVTLYIVNRSRIIFGSSCVALLTGLILIYVPQSRYTGSLLGLGVALIAVLFYQPPFVLLMLQAATFGVFLALGAGYVYRIFHRSNQWIPPSFPMDDMSKSYYTPPPSQVVHEVVMDSTNGDASETPIVNNGQ